MRSFSVTLREDSSHFGAQINLANLLLEFGLDHLASHYYRCTLSNNPFSVSAQTGAILASRGASDEIEELVAVIKWKLS